MHTNTVNIHVGPDGKLTDEHKAQIRESLMKSVAEEDRPEALEHLNKALDGYGDDPLKLSAATITAGLLKADTLLEALATTTLQLGQGLALRASQAPEDERSARGCRVFDGGEVHGQITAARLILISAAKDLDHLFNCDCAKDEDENEALAEQEARA
jgi:hypothetical protein